MIKSQISLELLIVFGTLVAVLVIILAMQTTIFGTFDNELNSVTITTTMDQILDASEQMYKQGKGATTQIKVKVPPTVKSSKITGAAIAYTLKVGDQNSTILKEKSFPINGTLPTNEGIYVLTIKNEKNFINISY